MRGLTPLLGVRGLKSAIWGLLAGLKMRRWTIKSPERVDTDAYVRYNRYNGIIGRRDSPDLRKEG